MRIGIVNDSAIAVECLRRILEASNEHEVSWVARSGYEALQCCTEDRPDLILMDIVMPGINGIEATSQIMERCPCPILIVTTSVDSRSGMVLEALRAGAIDVVKTPSFDLDAGGVDAQRLLRKIDNIEKLIGEDDQNRPTMPHSSPPRSPDTHMVTSRGIVVIGSSTGGPQALAEILSFFPVSLSWPLIVVQHDEARHIPPLVSWLDSCTKLQVKTIKEGDKPSGGTVHIACTDHHLIMNRDGTLSYTKGPKGSIYRPSIDIFFESVARNWSGRGIGVLLTGMGRDGAKGLLALKEAGWHTIAQDRETSVIYGMPKAAAESNAAVEVLPLSKIGASILRRIQTRGKAL